MGRILRSLTGAVASRIINERMQPLFKSGDFGGGLSAAVEQISRVIDGDALPPITSTAQGEGMLEQSDFAAAGIGAVLWFLGAGTGTTAFLALFGAAIAFALMEAIGAERKGTSGRTREGSDDGGSSWERSSSGSSSSESDSGDGGRSGSGGASGSW